MITGNPAQRAMEVLSMNCDQLAFTLGVSTRAVYSWTGGGEASARRIPELARRVLVILASNPEFAKTLRVAAQGAK